MNSKIALLSTFVASIALSSCGKTTENVSPSQLSADNNVYTLDVEADTMPQLASLLTLLKDATSDQTKTVMLKDLLSIIPLTPADQKKLSDAYPQPLALACDQTNCSLTGQGGSERAPISSNNADFSGVSIGVRTSLAAKFSDATDNSVNFCEVEGIYFSKFIVRKNLKSLKIEKFSDGGKITLWLAGADNIPGC